MYVVQFLVTPVSGLFLSNCHSIVGSFRRSSAYWCSSRVRNKILLLWQETGQHVVVFTISVGTKF